MLLNEIWDVTSHRQSAAEFLKSSQRTLSNKLIMP